MNQIKKIKKIKPKLEPVDRARCQAEHSNGVTFMTMGGRHEMVRCTNIPACVVREKRPGKDGRKGAMSMCPQCFAVFAQQTSRIYVDYTFEHLEAARQGEKKR